MNNIQTTVKELSQGNPGAFVGLAEIEGFFIYRGTDDKAWIASAEDDREPVVNLGSPEEICEALRGEVSAWAGGPYLYLNKAKVTGTLTSEENGYLLTDISTIEIWDDDELVQLSLEGTKLVPNPKPSIHRTTAQQHLGR